MQNLIIKIKINLFVLSKTNIASLFLFISGIFFPLHAQDISLISQNLALKKDSLSNNFYIKQKLSLTKSKKDSILLFYAWANAYKSNHSQLNKHLLENYNLDLHFTSKSKRGYIKIDSILVNNQPISSYSYTDQNLDILKIQLPVSIKSDTLQLFFYYSLHLPKSKYTGYGINQNKILLKDFYFTPVLDSTQLYHNQNLSDLPEEKSLFSFSFENKVLEKNIYTNLGPKNKINTKGYIHHFKVLFSPEKLDSFRVLDKQIYIAPLYSSKVSLEKKRLIINKLMSYFHDNLGEYPQKIILITASDLKNNPLYGPDWLPDFINPFDTSLLWEMRVLHQLSLEYAAQMKIDKRKYPWLGMAISSFAEYNYIQKYHPNLSLMGKLSDASFIKYYYISKASYAQKYPFLYLYMARMNKDQPLATALDKLSNFNRGASNPAKAALGMEMLKNEMGEKEFLKKLKKYFLFSTTKKTHEKDFYTYFDIQPNHWLYHYIHTKNKYDYKLKKITKKGDSLFLRIKNKKQYSIPLQIFGIKDHQITRIKNIPPIKKDSLIGISNKSNWEYIGVNYFNQYPEIQSKNNYQKVHHVLFNRPLQIRLFKDLENPLKKQLFVNPYFEYNYYDGLIIGAQFYNDGVLHNDFNYSLSPSYSTKAKKLSGSFSFSKTSFFDKSWPFSIKYGVGGSYYHYNFDLTYKKLNPFVALEFRDKDLRHRKGSKLKLGFMYIKKEIPEGMASEDSFYRIWDLNFESKEINIISDNFYRADLQLSPRFGKISGSYRLRWLTNKTSQMDIRFFAGYFLYNHTSTDYFSFALDRPTDYLFQYHYYGRSETSGIFHQQFIWAEGGFKTFFDDQYANQWLISNNLNIGLWKWFNLYGDLAYKKSRNKLPAFYYDSGFRINLVQDYFEIFFPVYSSKGFELTQKDYLKRIRLVFTIDLPRLQKMFTRGWY